MVLLGAGIAGARRQIRAEPLCPSPSPVMWRCAPPRQPVTARAFSVP